VQYPRLANRIKDDKIKKLAQELGTASVAHADIVASAIKKLGGSAEWAFEQLPEEEDLLKIFQVQLEKEQGAYKICIQLAGLAGDSQISQQLKGIAKDELYHIKLAEEIISELEK
jgi:rubrerythrin